MFFKPDIRRVISRRNLIKSAGLYLILFFLSLKIINAQDTNIHHVDLFIKNNVLFTRLHLQNFFDQNMKETIASGMSRRFNLKFELFRVDQKPLYSRSESLILKYDVWERIYLLNTAGFEKQFDDFEKFMFYISDSTVFSLGNTNRVDQNESLQLYVIFSHQEISEHQQKEIKSWIAHDAETIESQPGLETNQSFSINISKLLSLFFSRESFADLHIYKSPSFTLKSIYENENTTK
jgi:hypothetical protein